MKIIIDNKVKEFLKTKGQQVMTVERMPSTSC